MRDLIKNCAWRCDIGNRSVYRRI